MRCESDSRRRFILIGLQLSINCVSAALAASRLHVFGKELHPGMTVSG